MKTRQFVGMALFLSLTWPPVSAGEEETQPRSANVEAHGDWALQCPESASCFLMQRVFLKGNEEQPLINFILRFSGKPSRLLIAIRTPLEVMFAPGIELGVDKVVADAYPYHHCRSEVTIQDPLPRSGVGG